MTQAINGCQFTTLNIYIYPTKTVTSQGARVTNVSRRGTEFGCLNVVEKKHEKTGHKKEKHPGQITATKINLDSFRISKNDLTV